METISKKTIKNLLKKRRADSHKGTYGKVLIVAGSEGMAGAAVLTARGALRAGSGLVKVSIDKNLFPIIQTSVTEAMCIDRNLDKGILNEYDSVVVGPGLGVSVDAVETVKTVIGNYSGNLVLDADALNIVVSEKLDLKKAKGHLVITPHPGEAARLADTNNEDINKNREHAVSYLSELTNAVSVLKGYETLICLPRVEKSGKFSLYKNPNGNPGMATGGSGDVLSGIIASFLGQGINPADATIAGVFVHGLAGDLAADDLGEYGVTAGDIAMHTSYAIKNIQNK